MEISQTIAHLEAVGGEMNDVLALKNSAEGAFAQACG
jgi:hypothetical protein